MNSVSLRKRRKGFTVLETVIAATLLTSILMLGVQLLITSLNTMNNGFANASMENNSQVSIRRVTQRLREAASVIVDSDGMGITYFLPATNPDGSYTTPFAPSATVNRYYVSNGNLVEKQGTNPESIIMHNVYTPTASGVVNSQNGAGSPKIFTAASSGVVRIVYINLTVRKNNFNNYNVKRISESVYLRNIPDITH